ncbi:toll/interleukin-1 receptor domain-containing protein [Enterovibrio norvegicus]|uniref:TIR domain-containing protein n=1 Tax=Enterovibrio norvegicus TaxID=188144 RepID=A0A2N7L8Z9_9GAMM|nr:toll/interleukin-1 receptor domain-containing protein [Enterovibrio norvegicus]PMN90826.1 TIR domain-containing protein [Enterovibrio norvegicus]
MNGLEKIEFLEKLGVALQSRMTFDEIDIYFSGHKIDSKSMQANTNSKRVYAKDILSKVGDEVLFKIANELGIDSPNSTIVAEDATFWKAGHFRLFLSHLASFKVQTSRLQSALRRYAISSFVAHEDIEPTKEWQNEIEAGLRTMDALAAILMDGFKESNWCDQEVGVAVGRDVLIIPVRKGLDPYGFIGKYQGIQAAEKTVAEVAEAIFKTLVKSPKTNVKIISALSNSISQANDIEDALDKVNVMKSLDNVSSEALENLKQQVLENKILVESPDFISSLNNMLSKFKAPKIVILTQPTPEDWGDIPF